MSTKRKSGILVVTNHFQEDLRGTTEEQKEEVIGLLRVFMKEIREILKKSEKEVDRECLDMKERCVTCAFAPETDEFSVFAPTAYSLLWSIANYKFFICHSNQPNWRERNIERERLKLCGGFETITTAYPGDVLELAEGTMLAIEKIISNVSH